MSSIAILEANEEQENSPANSPNKKKEEFPSGSKSKFAENSKRRANSILSNLPS